MIDDEKKRSLIETIVQAECQETKTWLEENSHYVIIGDKEIPVYIFLPPISTSNVNNHLSSEEPEVIYYSFDDEEDEIEDQEFEELWAEYESKYSPIKRVAHITLNGRLRNICTTYDVTNEEWNIIQLALIKMYKDEDKPTKINANDIMCLCH